MKTLCVSLDTAKALKAAGWSKPTAFVYEDLGHRQQLRLGTIKMNYGDCYAPTAEEILRELPGELPDNSERDLVAYKHFGGWAVQYGGESLEEYETKEGKSLSEAAAQMWLWCVENGICKCVPCEGEENGR